MIRNLALILVIQAATAWAQYTCPDAGLFCASCTSLAICTGAGETGNEIDCQTGQLCGVSGPFASCYANTATETSACQCESSGGYLVDPYLPSQYFICLPGGEQLAVTCDATESFDPEQNACTVMPEVTTPTPPTCSGIGLFAVSCTRYAAAAARAPGRCTIVPAASTSTKSRACASHRRISRPPRSRAGVRTAPSVTRSTAAFSTCAPAETRSGPPSRAPQI
nr:uncharacterized protein LOC113827971 [Penaeus vannamei]